MGWGEEPESLDSKPFPGSRRAWRGYIILRRVPRDVAGRPGQAGDNGREGPSRQESGSGEPPRSDSPLFPAGFGLLWDLCAP